MSGLFSSNHDGSTYAEPPDLRTRRARHCVRLSWRCVTGHGESFDMIGNGPDQLQAYWQSRGKSSCGGRPRRNRAAKQKFVSEIVNSLDKGRVVSHMPACLAEQLRRRARSTCWVSSLSSSAEYRFFSINPIRLRWRPGAGGSAP